ncbi:Type I Iterative PKS [Trichoderma virens FT-333]|nr:Type I Iterative PKS [Trichoderma virens FT-333]
MEQNTASSKPDTLTNMEDGSIAIVGMACRFANVSSPTQFWDMIEKGRSGHGRIPERCFDADAWYHPSRARRGTVITKSGFFLDDVSHFDAPFFSITASEAAAMDPMQRLGLEVAYETFENAGITMKQLSGSRTAVYSGVMTADYQEIAEGDLFRLGDHPGSGTAKSILANRISWFFDLRGPSLSLDTACSSALYSLHLACQAVQAGECDQALVTGTNLILHPNLMAQFTAMHMITPDGISHTFDESANGYGRPLKDAIRDGDVVRAVIRATGANFDGKTTGMTVPSGDAQAELIRETYKKAGISMNDTCYFEAHGTGTPLGDPIEMQAIAKTIGSARKCANNGPLYVGSVKPNVGHTGAVLCLEAGVIPAVTRLKKLNPKLLLDDWNIIAPMENVSWPQAGIRRASVNSFGFGGANAHVILDDALHYLLSRGIQGRHITHTIPLLADSSINNDLEGGSSSSSSSATSCSDSSSSCSDCEDSPASVGDDTASERAQDVEHQDHLFVFSAQDQGSLNRVASGYAEFLKDEPYKDDIVAMQSLSHILSEKRTKLDFRSFVDKAIFVFTGQGAQRSGMARELLSDPVFGESIRLSQKVVTACGGDWDIEHMLTTGTAQELGNPLYSQPLCTAIQIGLVDMLSSWNVQPAAVIGHSSGEIAAAYSSGVLSHEDAMYVAYYRGTLSSVVSSRAGIQGSMLAAGISESEAAKYVVDKASVTIACINSPSSVTLSGESSAIAEVHDALVNDGKFSRQLRTGVAYHSSYMAVVSEDSKQLLAGLDERLRPMRVPMFSSVTEERIESCRLGGSYWMENMLSPVRFAGAMRNLVTGTDIDGEKPLDTEYSAIIEIGPSKTLQGPIKQILTAVSPRLAKKLPYRSMLVAGSHARKTSLEAAGYLWSTGHSIDLGKVNGISAASELDLCMLPRLPMYPWNHENSFWHEHLASNAVRLRKEPRTDLLGMPVDGQNPFEPRWRNLLSVTENPWLGHHRVASACLFPAAGYLVMAVEAVLKLAAKDVQKGRVLRGVEITDVTFETGLALSEDGSATDISITLKPHATMDATYDFSIYSDSFDQPALERIDTVSPLENEALFGGTACGTLTVPDTKAIMPMEYEFPHLLHPATLDSAFHLAFAALQTREDMLRPAVPVSIQRCFISADLPSDPGSKFFGMALIKRIGKTALVTDIFFADAEVNGPQIVIESMGLSDVGEVSTQDAGYGTANLAGSNRRAADVVWKEDVTLMQLPSDTNLQDNQSPLSSWLECFLHKYSNANILFAGAERSMPLLETLQGTVASHQRAGGQGKLFSCSLPPSLQSDASEEHNATPTYMHTILANGPYNAVILCDHGNQTIDFFLQSMSRLLNPGGQIIRLDDISGCLRIENANEVDISVVECVNTGGVTILERTVNHQNPEALRLREALTDILGQAGITVTVKCMDQIPIHTNNSYIISLVEYGQGLVCDWGEEELVQFQNLVASARYVLWLTTGGLMAPNEDGLKYSLTQGLLRTTYRQTVQGFMKKWRLSRPRFLLRHCLVLPTVVVEAEYAELNCKIFIPRLLRDVAMDAEIEVLSSNSTTIDIQLNDCRQPLRLSTTTGSVQWMPCEPYSPIGAGEVLVETRYVAGSTSKMAPMSWTIVGVVCEVGDCVPQYRVGDFVIPLDISGDLDVKTSFLINASDILRVPKNISATQLAYWITPFIVAHRVLINQQQSSSSTSYGALSDAKIFTHLASDLRMKLQPNYTPPESAGSSPPRSSTPELRESQQADAGGVLIDVEDSALRTALGQTAHWLGLKTFVVVPESEQTDENELSGCTVLRQMTRPCSRMMRNKNGASGIHLVLSSLQEDPKSVPHLMASLAPGGRFVAVNTSTDRESSLRTATPASMSL